MLLTFIAITATPVVDQVACAKLADQYENASKALAFSFAEGIGDNSAPRATMRETREGNVRQEARDNLELMKANGCKLPTSAPNAGPYVAQAMQCHLDQTKNQYATLRGKPTSDPASCDMTKWINSRVEKTAP